MPDHREPVGGLDFDDLYRRLAPKLKAMLTSYTGDSQIAEDVTQETMLRAYRFEQMFNPAAPVWPWLSTIARRVHSSSRRGELPTEELTGALERQLAAVFPDPRLDPAEQHDAWESEILPTLPEIYSRALMMKYVLGLRMTEIAEIEGITRMGVKSRLNRARRMFSEAAKARSGENGWRLGIAAFVMRRLRGPRADALAIVGNSGANDIVLRLVGGVFAVIATLVVANAFGGSVPTHRNDAAHPAGARSHVDRLLAEHLYPGEHESVTTMRVSSKAVLPSGSSPVEAHVGTNRDQGRRTLSLGRTISYPSPIGGDSETDGRTHIYCDQSMVAQTGCDVADALPPV